MDHYETLMNLLERRQHLLEVLKQRRLTISKKRRLELNVLRLSIKEIEDEILSTLKVIEKEQNE